MECNDFHKIKYNTLQLASTSVCTPHTHTHTHTCAHPNDSGDFTVVSNKQTQG
jgi:hypothetical protein